MKNSFVYIWINLINNKKYIGYHKGSKDDGYICSSKSKIFWEDFYNPEMRWDRIIVFEGTRDECVLKEQSLLYDLDLRTGNYYNLSKGAQIFYNNEVLEKMSKSAIKKWENIDIEKEKIRRDKISKSKLGIKQTKETCIKKSKSMKGWKQSKETIDKRIKSNTGKKRTEKFKKEQSERFTGEKHPMFGKTRSEEFKNQARNKWLGEKNPNYGGLSKEHKQKISESKKGWKNPNKGKSRKIIKCPYCNKEGAEGLMGRWHFEKCKFK